MNGLRRYGGRWRAVALAAFLLAASGTGAGGHTASSTRAARAGHRPAVGVAGVPAAARAVSARFVRPHHGGAWSRWHAVLLAGTALVAVPLLTLRNAQGRRWREATRLAGVRPRAPPAPAPA
jgi:hypothetical protein